VTEGVNEHIMPKVSEAYSLLCSQFQMPFYPYEHNGIKLLYISCTLRFSFVWTAAATNFNTAQKHYCR
jgi:hypothetical protein